MAQQASDRILELNGGKPVSAVFVVGGGGKIPGYTEAIAEKLGQIFAQPAEALFEKGMAAREFILKEKNNVKQAGKILAMLERDGVQ